MSKIRGRAIYKIGKKVEFLPKLYFWEKRVWERVIWGWYFNLGVRSGWNVSSKSKQFCLFFMRGVWGWFVGDLWVIFFEGSFPLLLNRFVGLIKGKKGNYPRFRKKDAHSVSFVRNGFRKKYAHSVFYVRNGRKRGFKRFLL